MKNTNNSTTYNTLAVILTIMVLVLIWKLILPSYSANKSKAANLETETLAAQNKKDSLDKAKTDLTDVDAAYQAITVSISNGSDEPGLISELEAIALKNGIVLPSISISSADAANAQATAADGSSLSEALDASPITISLSVSGNFDQLNGLIAALEKSVKFMNIKSTNFSLADDGSLALSLQIEAYSRAESSVAAGSVNGVSSVSRTAL